MSYQRSRKQKISAKERRIQDRELARVERERRKRRAKVRHLGLRVAAVVGILAVLAGAGLGVRAAVAAGRRGPANMPSDGIVLSSDGTTTSAVTGGAPLPDNGTPTPTADLSAQNVTQIVAYVDYADPASAAFWATNGAAIEGWVTASQGQLTLELHPVAVPTARESFTPMPAPTPTGSATASATPTPTPAPSPTASAAATPAPSSSATPAPTPTPTTTPNLRDAGYDYALRAANAVACVANGDPNQVLAVNDALFAAQPTFGTAGLSDDQMVALTTKAGVTAGGVEKCIRSHHYERWVTQATARVSAAVPFTGVKALTTAPLVVVAGHQYTSAVDDANAFLGLVMQAYSEVNAKSNPTPTPTPSDTASPTPVPTTGATPSATPSPSPTA